MSNSPTPIDVDLWLDRLHDSGYRVTAPRRAIVEVVAHSQRALNPAQIFDLARIQHPAIGLVTVYRTLERLTELHLIDRVHLPQGCDAYLPTPVGHQHLLICEHCGLIQYFSGDNLTDLTRRVEADSGYKISAHWLQFFGRCPNCPAA